MYIFKHHIHWFLLGILFVILLIIGYLLFFTAASSNNELLQVHFLDVGQGDATFIESPSGMQVLIDGGATGDVLRELSNEMGFFDHDIDMVIATHPDQDHIGGLIDVLQRYNVSTIVRTENVSDTPVSSQFDERVLSEGADVIYARSGQVFAIGNSEAGPVLLAVLFPDRDTSGLESNTSSIIIQLTYGSTEFLFTGDSPQAIEEYLVTLYGSGLESDVLKVGHHGSRTSTDESFLREVNPEYAIISAGKDNRYGHPHQEVIDLLNQFSIETKNTAENGSITIKSNGQQLFVR